ncbi:MAG: hypothetical protein LUE93_15305 [Bacteroides sp.]|nr:hypothetical protein [Bacteroides sp.]
MKTITSSLVGRVLLVCIGLCLGTATLSAGEPEKLAEKIFGYLQQGRGDSIAVYMQEEIRSQIPPEALGQVFTQLEA